MNTEITDNEKFNGWVLYDGDCRLCTGMARRFRKLLAGRRFELLPLQTVWVKTRLALPDSQLLDEMRFLRPDGKFFGGADALLEIAHYFWWAWPLRQLGRIPSVAKILRAGYRWVARNRDCATGTCEVKTHRTARSGYFVDLLPLLILPILAVVFRPHMVSWVFMWAMAFSLYAGCKWLTYRETVRRGMKPDFLRALAYLFAWPGMDAASFLDARNVPAKPHKKEWAFAVGKMVFGLVLVWGAARTLLPAFPLLIGWVGMIGVVFMLQFGWFHILSLFWRQKGIAAKPVMQNPIASTSLAEFWGKRWNTAFHELAFRYTFRPLRRLMPATTATLSVFGFSGLIHELCISVPARGGYGLPTLYFLIQGLGSIIERSPFGRRIGLGQGICGWLFTLLVTVAPVYWLFHPPFIKNIILQMLTAIGAT